jgi:3-hydroxyisobutyrate dehydrogenase-like beta-hydroxyacid dehydrogenase
MGTPMATNLLKHYKDSLHVYDRVPSNLNTLIERGAPLKYLNVHDIVRHSDIVITVLPATQHVKDLMLGNAREEGIFNSARKGTLFIDSSTIDPRASKELYQHAKGRGLRMIDAPISGEYCYIIISTVLLVLSYHNNN